jgi:Sec-independent protein secretion pathway component TatC
VVLAAGIVFQLPILVYFLSKVGLVTPDFLKRYRRHSLVLIVTLSAIITPPDVFSQVLVALPLLILYEIGIAISKRIVRQQEEEMAGGGKTADKKSSGKKPKGKEPVAKQPKKKSAEKKSANEKPADEKP